jgi:hypothetical protein
MTEALDLQSFFNSYSRVPTTAQQISFLNVINQQRYHESQPNCFSQHSNSMLEDNVLSQLLLLPKSKFSMHQTTDFQA